MNDEQSTDPDEPVVVVTASKAPGFAIPTRPESISLCICSQRRDGTCTEHPERTARWWRMKV